MLFVPLVLSLLTLPLAFPFPGLRFLDSKSHSTSSSIEIPIKADDADYHFTAFTDLTTFYCEKTMGPLGVNDICVLQKAQMTLANSMTVPNLAPRVFPIGDRMLFFKENLIYVHGLQTDFDRPRVQLLAAMSLGSRDDPSPVDNIYFDTMNQYIVVLKGSKMVFYRFNGLALEHKAQVIDPPVTPENFQDKKIFYFLEKFVAIYDRSDSILIIYTINTDTTLTLERSFENCQEVHVDSRYVFAFTQDKLKAFNGEEELAVNFAYLIKSVRKGHGSGMIVYAENLPDSPFESVIYQIDCFGTSGFRLEPLLNVPRGGKAMYSTNKNLFMVYENWVRGYPVIKDKQFNWDFHFDFVISSEVIGLLVSQGQEFLIIKGDRELDVKLLASERSAFGLECKKEKGSEVVEYTFQVRCLGTVCDEAGSGTQKFTNGTCGTTSQVKVYPEEEGGTIGVALLVGLGLIAGIAITMGLGVFNCFAKPSKESVKAHSPRDKRIFSRSRSVRRYTSGNDSYNSEDMYKEQLSTSLNAAKKKSTPVFETPRFTSFGTSGSHGHCTSDGVPHSHIGYSHVGSTDLGIESSEVAKSSGENETDVLEEKDQGKVKVEKLKLGDRVVVKDPATFRKELASFRDMVITHVIPEENQKDETDRKSEVKYEMRSAGKYEAFHDDKEEEEDEEDVDLEDEFGEVDSENEQRNPFSG